MFDLIAASLIGPAPVPLRYELLDNLQILIAEAERKQDRVDFPANSNGDEFVDPPSAIDVNGGCSKAGSDSYIGRLQRRKECELVARIERRLSSGSRLEISGTIERSCSGGTGPVDFGDPRPSISRGFGAALFIGDGWRISGARFDDDGWGTRGFAWSIRQLTAGDDRGCRGERLESGWSRTASESGSPLTGLALRIEMTEPEEPVAGRVQRISSEGRITFAISAGY